PGGGRVRGRLGRVLATGDDDSGGVGGGKAGVERPDHQHGQGAAEDLGGDERRDGGGGDTGERVGEHAADGDRRVGEAGGRGEKVRRAHVGAPPPPPVPRPRR